MNAYFSENNQPMHLWPEPEMPELRHFFAIGMNSELNWYHLDHKTLTKLYTIDFYSADGIQKLRKIVSDIKKLLSLPELPTDNILEAAYIREFPWEYSNEAMQELAIAKDLSSKIVNMSPYIAWKEKWEKPIIQQACRKWLEDILEILEPYAERDPIKQPLTEEEEELRRKYPSR